MTDLGEEIARAARLWPRLRLRFGRGNGLRFAAHSYWLDEDRAGFYVTFGYDGGDALLELELEPVRVRSPRLVRLVERFS